MGTRYFVHHRIVSAVTRVEIVSDRISYIVLRDHLCNIIVLNVYSSSEEKCDDSKDSFYEEFEKVCDQISKYSMKIILVDCNAKVGRANIINRIVGNDSLHQDSNDNGVKRVRFAHKKNWF